MPEIERLAELLQQRNQIDAGIARLIGRPALPGHVGEYIAASVFGIALHDSASAAASDGLFVDGPLAGKSVQVKLYGKDEGLLDLPREGAASADYTLVLAGPRSAAPSSKGSTRPLVITTVYLFQTAGLVTELRTIGVKIGIATSIRRHLWDAAEIYPKRAGPLVLNDAQRGLLALFAPVSQRP
jgi:hypothetical protein